MFLIAVTFLLTTALYGFLLWLAARRVLHHLKENPEGVKAVTAHVLIPLLGRRPNDDNPQPAGEPPLPTP